MLCLFLWTCRFTLLENNFVEVFLAALENHAGFELVCREAAADIAYLLVICGNAALLDIAASLRF